MSDVPYIPKATQEKLNAEHPKGTRHTAAKEISLSLVGNGFSPAAVYQQLRDKFPADVTDAELEGVVRWAVNKQPTPSGFGNRPSPQFHAPQILNRPVESKPKPPLEHAQWWLNGETITVEAFIEASQLAVPADHKQALVLAFEMLYNGADVINVVCDYLERDGKASPLGAGLSQTRDGWLEYIADKGVPQSKAGAWVRPNPCNIIGSGHEGAIMDSDVVKFRFLLIESDVLPLALQLALFSKLSLPIAAVLTSGGLSAHAWVRMDSPDIETHAEHCRRILTALKPFGIDQANKNPSRLSRLPGAKRTIGASGDGLQRLLWLNPGKPALTEKDITDLEESLLIPAIEEKPFRRVIEEAIPRYEDLINNRGQTGVMTGLPTWDNITGGLKPGWMVVLSAGTGVGKSCLAMNFFNHSLRHGIGVACFSMEMMREELCDMMFSLNCNIDRNKFNTGEFNEDDIKRMIGGAGWMKNLPLWIEDTASQSMERIRLRTLQLVRDKRIGFVVIDYLQLVDPPNPRESREQQVANIGRSIRVLAKESKLPILVLSQLNDFGLLRESRAIGHEANVVLALDQDSPDNFQNMTLKVMKGRNIPKTKLPLVFHGEYCRLAERAKITEDDKPEPRRTSEPPEKE